MQDNNRGDRPVKKPFGDRKSFADKKPFAGKKTLTTELVDLDRDIAALLARRTRLLARAAAARHAKGLSLADANQERRMRRAWDDVAAQDGMDVRPLRQIFTLANGLAYGFAVKPESSRRKFIMNLDVHNKDLDLVGPASCVRTRLITALAAGAEGSCELEPVVVNDALVELVRALNQGGAKLSWQDNQVKSAGGKLDFAGKTLHAGDDPLNFYVLLAMALPQIGRTTVTGGTNLKLLDVTPAAGVLAGLGVRLTSIEPHISGAPVRLESAGMISGNCAVPSDFPPELALGMALAAPTYPQGLHMTWEKGWSGKELLHHAVDVLASCGVRAKLTDTDITVPAGTVKAPKALDPNVVYLDPELTSVLLALPRFSGASVTVSGLWNSADPKAKAASAMLKAAGVEITASATSVRATAGPWPNDLDLDATKGFFPLAVALGLAAPGDARIQVKEDEDTSPAEEMAGRMGRFARVSSGKVVIVGGGSNRWADPMKPYPSPSAAWSLSLALASTTTRGVTLANPGSLSEIWPGFWGLFADNFTPKEKETPHANAGKKGRRIRVRED